MAGLKDIWILFIQTYSLLSSFWSVHSVVLLSNSNSLLKDMSRKFMKNWSLFHVPFVLLHFVIRTSWIGTTSLFILEKDTHANSVIRILVSRPIWLFTLKKSIKLEFSPLKYLVFCIDDHTLDYQKNIIHNIMPTWYMFSSSLDFVEFSCKNLVAWNTSLT